MLKGYVKLFEAHQTALKRGYVEQIVSFKTRGRGIKSLRAYYETLRNDLPPRLPTNSKEWVSGSQYDAPHGFLYIQDNGHWLATYSLASVVADIQRISGVTVRTSES